MTKEEILRQLDEDIERTQASVRFWRKQEDLQAGTNYAALICATADAYDAQLKHLLVARDEIAEA